MVTRERPEFGCARPASLSGPFAAEVLGHFRPLVVNGLVERGPPLRLGLCVEIRATIDSTQSGTTSRCPMVAVGLRGDC